MKSLDNIAEDLFNKIRGRFPSVTIGNQDGKITNDPLTARFFDFDYKDGPRTIGKVSISVSEDALAVMYSNSFVEDEDSITRENWYNFLKELRTFAKKRLLKFDTRDITKSNLDKRDYKFLAQNQGGEQTMSESKLYGTSRVSYQDIGNSRLVIKHTESVNQELASGRTQKIGKIYIESSDGERFMYPYKHLSGARAMARHVSEGGKPFDDFGQHIKGLSEELANLKKFKNYMNRSSVMAESLSEYMDAVRERIQSVKKTVESLQKESYYKETFESFEAPTLEEVPDDVAENWIDQLTIKQFNEDLKDVFPYVYKLVSEVTKAKELGPEDLMAEAGPVDNVEVGLPAETYKVQKGDTMYSIYKKFKDANFQGDTLENAIEAIMDENPEIEDPAQIQPGMVIQMPYFMGSGPSGSTRGLPPGGFKNYESAIEELLGQFSDSEVCQECGNPSWTTLGMTEEEIEEGERHGNDSMYDKCWKGYRRVPGTSRGEKGSCKKIESDQGAEEGNAYAKAVRQAKMNGKKKGDEIDGPDGEKITLEQEIPVSEFILSLFDRNTGEFPKGETAVLTSVEKDYGEQFIEPAKAFIARIRETYDNYQMENNPQQFDTQEFDDMKRLAGLR